MCIFYWRYSKQAVSRCVGGLLDIRGSRGRCRQLTALLCFRRQHRTVACDPTTSCLPVAQHTPGSWWSMMARTQLLRELVNEQLAAAAEQIFQLVETTIAEYQDEVVRSKKEVIQLKKQLEQLAVLKAEVVLSRTSVSGVFLMYSNC